MSSSLTATSARDVTVNNAWPELGVTQSSPDASTGGGEGSGGGGEGDGGGGDGGGEGEMTGSAWHIAD